MGLRPLELGHLRAEPALECGAPLRSPELRGTRRLDAALLAGHARPADAAPLAKALAALPALQGAHLRSAHGYGKPYPELPGPSANP
jgi:hypothetical protein